MTDRVTAATSGPGYAVAAMSQDLWHSESGRQDLQQMAIRILEVEPASAQSMVDCHVIGRTRAAAVSKPLVFDPLEDRIELRVAHFEGVVMRFETRARVEVQDQRVVQPDRGEVRHRSLE